MKLANSRPWETLKANEQVSPTNKQQVKERDRDEEIDFRSNSHQKVDIFSRCLVDIFNWILITKKLYMKKRKKMQKF